MLENAYLMDIADTFKGKDYICLQDGAPAHTSGATQKWRQANLSKFRDKKSWPPASPDLNVLDYFAWGWLQKRVSEFNPTNLQTLKIAIRNAVLEMPIEQVRASVEGWYKRAALCIQENGHQFKRRQKDPRAPKAPPRSDSDAPTVDGADKLAEFEDALQHDASADEDDASADEDEASNDEQDENARAAY